MSALFPAGPVRTSLVYLFCVCAAAFAVSAGMKVVDVSLEGLDSTNVFIIWAVLSLCHAVHWHTWKMGRAEEP